MFSFEIKNTLLANVAKLAAKVDAEAKKALRAEAEIIMTEAKRRTPVLTGTLRASGFVSPVEGEIAMRLTFGGPAASYAVFVHEIPPERATHKVGQWKYLESAVLEAASHMAQSVSVRMNQWLSSEGA